MGEKTISLFFKSVMHVCNHPTACTITAKAGEWRRSAYVTSLLVFVLVEPGGDFAW